MARERELKLAVGEASIARILEWLKNSGATRLPKERLCNTYFDTPDGQLNQKRVALRVRQSGRQYIQTLKTKGAISAGLHDRQEWDWSVSGPQLDLALLAESPIAEFAQQATLEPAFTTDFERDGWLWRDENLAIEFALDRGTARAGSHAAPICEVELELKGGEVTGLAKQAATLSRICPVFLNPISKAELGYNVAGIYEPQVSALESTSTQGMIDGWFQALGYFMLTGEESFLAQARLAVERLARIQPDEAPNSQSAFAWPMQKDWRQLIDLHRRWNAGSPEEARAQLLDDPLLGQCQLKLVSG